MLDQKKDTRGFTLAEVLLSVAIILVLAAIAIPSVVNAQRNMRQVELDSAASQIALAAQSQMTSMKVSGTWTEKVKGITGRAINYQGEGEADTYYMTAEQAKSTGVLTSLSIDESVYNGDYVIEFNKTTASITSVFYSDRKGGFFGSSNENVSPASDYYKNSGSRASGTIKMQDNYQVGVYEGTPAGATKAVALENPNIYIDEKEGLLCVQVADLVNHSSYGMSLQLTVEQKDEAGKFVISGMQNGTSTYTVSLKEDSENDKVSLLNTAYKIYEIGSRPTDNVGATPASDVFKINLNELAKIMSEHGTDNLKNEFKKFSSGQNIKVTAKVVANNKPCVPATSKAFIQWPGAKSKITVLVTDPNIDQENAAKGSHVEGKYTAPVVKIVSSDTGNGSPSMGMSTSKVEQKITGTPDDLKTENAQAAQQNYSGSWIGLEEVKGVRDALIEASVGSYTPKNGTKTHSYQIYEMYADTAQGEVKLGFMRDNKWVWTTEGGYIASAISGVSTGTDTSGMKKIELDPQKVSEALANYQKLKDKDEGFTLYVRTAPALSEVKSYLDGISNLGEYVNGGTSFGSRDTTNPAKSMRKDFENEFGAASSVASWTLSRSTNSGIKDFPKNSDDIRIYYSITPALTFNDDLTAKDNELTNAVLWYYSYNGNKYVSEPQAMVREARSKPDDQARNLVMVGPNAGAKTPDFRIPIERDYLFYRVLKYYDTNGTTSLDSLPWQYVPYSAQKEIEVKAGKNKTDASGRPTDEFVNWLTNNTYGVEGNALSVEAHKAVLNYDDKLAYGEVALRAQYQELGLGFMYLEFNKAGEVDTGGYYGFVNERLSDKEYDPENAMFLSTDNTIASWGYYAVVPARSSGGKMSIVSCKTAEGSAVNRNEVKVSADKTKTCEIPGLSNRYDVYEVTVNPNSSARMSQYIEVELEYSHNNSIYRATYRFNPNFAAEVSNATGEAKGESNASNWGMDEKNAWKVRHAEQFPGTFSRTIVNNSSIMAYYVGNDEFFFQQRHDIDAKDKPTYNSNMGYDSWGKYNKFDMPFRGTYCGAIPSERFLIKNFRYWLGNYYSTGTQGQGVFPSIENAKLKQITISDDNAGSWDVSQITTNSTVKGFGCLIGYAENSEVESCVVLGKAGAALNVISSNISADSSALGGFVGLAKGTTFTNCQVNNIKLIFDSNNKNPWNSDWCVGGFAGRIEEKSLIKNETTQSSPTELIKGIDPVSTVAIETSTGFKGQTRSYNPIYLGGLVGKAVSSQIDMYNGVRVGQTTFLFNYTFEQKWEGEVKFGYVVGSMDDPMNLIRAGARNNVNAQWNGNTPEYIWSAFKPIGDK